MMPAGMPQFRPTRGRCSAVLLLLCLVVLVMIFLAVSAIMWTADQVPNWFD